MLEGTRLGRKFCSVSSPRLSAGAGQRREQGRGGDAQARLQRRHQQEAERDVGEDVGRQVEAGVVARPGGGEEVERRRAGVAPARERMQAGIGRQQRVGDGEVEGQRRGGGPHEAAG
jgi:hypothetical protein